MTPRSGEPASRCLAPPHVGAARFVGDPVDIVTGAVVDQETDFRLPRAAIPLSWVRRFDSRQLANDRGLGRGVRHTFDRELRFDLDGIRYVDAEWNETTFPHLERDGQRSTQPTCVLERFDEKRYRVHDSDEHIYDFTFGSAEEPARLDRIGTRHGSLTLYYERIGGREQLSSIALGMLGRLRVTWAEGRIKQIALDETELERETLLATYRYDERGCLVEAQNAYRHSLRYEFDAAPRLIRKVDRRGYAFVFAYDAEGRCIESRGEDGAEGVRLEYRPLERTTLVKRHDGGTWRYQYSATGTITHVLDPYDGLQAYVLDGRGRVLEEIDPLGNSYRIRYSPFGVAEERVDDFGHIVALPEDPSAPGPLEHRVAQTPLEWEYGTLFAAPKRLPITGDPLWNLPFQARPLIQTSEPEWGGRTHTERNVQGLPFRELREDGKARHWTFDHNANVSKHVDFDGHASSYAYVSDNHLASETDALGRVTRYEYSPTERLTALTDPGGTRSQYILDLKDRVSEVHRDGKLRERYAYDGGDNVVEKRNGSDQLLFEQTIGPGNRKVARKLGSGELQTFAYDERGRLREARGTAGTCNFTYDEHFGARTSDLRQGLGVEHGRDFSGSRTTTVLGRFTTRWYRQSETRFTLVDPTGRTHALSERAAGVYERKFSNGVREISQFDVRGRCLAKALYRRFEDDQPWLRGFHYSGEGDLNERRNNQRGITHFTYDSAHRLQNVIHPNRHVDAYEYDLANNLLSMPSMHPQLRAAGEPDRFQVGSGNRLRAAHGDHFEYDDRDHVSRRIRANHAVEYQHDALDQLVEIRSPEHHFRATYDPLGRRIEKTVNGATTTYYWDTDRLAAELFPNGTTRIYIYASELALVPILFIDYASFDAAPESGSVFYVFTDHLGAVELVLNQAGESAWQAQLDPYGLADIQTSAPFHQPLRFPGHLFDSETGLHYNRFRYYDPTLGRYLESDPIGISGGHNLYAYTNNPLREVDTRGLAGKCPNGADCPQNKKKSTEDNEAVEGTDTPSPGNKPAAPEEHLVPVTAEHEAKLKNLSPGVSAHEVALAEHRNLTEPVGQRQVDARKRVAEAFYKKNGQQYALRDEHNQLYGKDPRTNMPIKKVRPLTQAERQDQLDAINYDHPVAAGPPPPCKTKMEQWQPDRNDRGNYFADKGPMPEQLGTGPRGVAWNKAGQPVEEKQRTTHSIDPDTPNLESTAGPADDNWSIPNVVQPTPGGARQTYIPQGCDPDSTMVQ